MHISILSKSLKAFLVRVAALAGGLTLVVLVSSVSVFAGQSPPTDSTPDGVYVVARVDGEPVTAEAVDAVWRREEPGVWLQNMPHLYQARLGALRIAVAEVVLGQHAADEGLDLESFIIREIDRAASPPTEAEIDQAVRALVRTQPTIPEEFPSGPRVSAARSATPGDRPGGRSRPRLRRGGGLWARGHLLRCAACRRGARSRAREPRLGFRRR